MRKQRYQRTIATSKDPDRVNTSTVDQDMKMLNTQVEALKTIWADDEEKAAKKGNSYNSIDQDVKDYENNLNNWSSSEEDLTVDELEQRSKQFGGQAYIELSQGHAADTNKPSPLKLAIEGDKVTLANSIQQELIDKYGQEEFNNYLVYSSENQSVIDKTARFKKLASAIPANSYTDSYFAKRGVNPEDYMSKEEVAQLHISKYTQKAKDYIDGVKLNGANTKSVTEKLSEKIAEANLPNKEKESLFSHLANKLSKQEREREALVKLASEKLKSDYLNGRINSIKNTSILTDDDAKSVGNVEFSRKLQNVDEGRITWANFAQKPQDPRARDIHQAKYTQKVNQEYVSIKRFAADSDNIFGFKTPDNIPADEEFAVELTYNYFNEQKRKNPEFTLEDARSALFSKTGSQPEGQKINVQLLLTNSHRHIDSLGLTKKEYMNLFKSEAGRQKILDLGVQKGDQTLNFLKAYQTMETNYENTRSSTDKPRTN